MALIPVADAKIGHVTTAMAMAMAINNMDQIRSRHHHQAGCRQDGCRLLQDRPGLGLDCRLRRRAPTVATTNSHKAASTGIRAVTRHQRLRRAMVDTTSHLDGISMVAGAVAKGRMIKVEAEAEVAAIEVEGVIEGEWDVEQLMEDQLL